MRRGKSATFLALTAAIAAACSAAPPRGGAAIGTGPAIPETNPPAPTEQPTPAPTRTAAAPARPAAAPQPVPERWRGRIVTVLNSRKIALTIDLGSGSEGLASILGTLRRKDVPASFFVTGRFARANPQAVRDIAAAGHLVGNHSFRHPDFRTLSEPQQRRQLRKTNHAVREHTGRTTKPWFRFPYGSYDGAAIAAANSMGYATIGWTVDSLGWQGTGQQSKRSVRQRVVAAARPGAIVLLHGGAHADGSTLDADALPGIIRRLRAQGYGFTQLVTP